MKRYKEVKVTAAQVYEVRCNCCGRRICRDEAHPYTDYLSIEKEWGYDSPYDGERHTADICADCYQKWIGSFVIPPEETGAEE